MSQCLRRLVYLILKRASTSRSSGEWNDDDFDILADGAGIMERVAYQDTIAEAG